MNKPLYECAVCNEWFDSMEAMHQHEQQFHNPQEDAEVSSRSAGGTFPCPECGVHTYTEGDLEVHLVREHPERTGMGEAPIRKRGAA